VLSTRRIEGRARSEFYRQRNLVADGPVIPSGIVFYGGPGFVVSHGGVSGPSRFIFSNEDGGISGWAPKVNFTNAIRVVNGALVNGERRGRALVFDP
jgi:hypothetical protein